MLKQGKIMGKYLILLTEISKIGGIEVFSNWFLKEALKQLKTSEVHVVIYNQDKKTKEVEDLEKTTGARFYICGSKYKLLKLIKYIFITFSLFMRIKKGAIIANHINLLKATHLYLKIWRGIKYCVFVYGIDAWNLSKKEKNILENASIIASFSKYTADKIKDQISCKLNFLLFPPSVDEEKFLISCKNESLIEKYKLYGKKVILTVCRLSETEKYKGYDKVILALKKVIEKNKDVVYLLAGEGSDIKRINKIVEDLQIGENVRLCGFVPNDQAAQYYNLCDLFIMPSKKEGFGIVFLEALACGKPVIVGNQDASIEAVLGGELGLLVNPDDVDDIAQKIQEILERKCNPNLLNPDFLREKVIKSFGKKTFEEKTKNLIAQINEKT